MNDDYLLNPSSTVRDVKRRIVSHDSDYLGLSELASVLGMSRQATSNWRVRGKLPEPHQQLAMGPVWSRDDLLAWLSS